MLSRIIFLLSKVSITKSIFINFKCLPLSQAFKFPILVGKKMRFNSLKGDVLIEGPVYPAMIKIGVDLFFRDGTNRMGVFENLGRIIFNGKAIFHSGCIIATGQNGVVSFGDNFSVGADSLIYSRNSLVFGANVLISWDFQVTDTDFHYIKKVDNSIPIKNTEPVIIGDRVWIGNHVNIGKGVILPSGTIVSSTSYVNKKFLEDNCVIGGIPAKVLKAGFVYVCDLEEEHNIDRQF